MNMEFYNIIHVNAEHRMFAASVDRIIKHVI